MRILKLTPTVEDQLLRARQQRDLAAEKIASRIVQDVRRRGDQALFAWAKKLDACDLRRTGVWISQAEMRAARKKVSPEFLRAVWGEHGRIRCELRRQPKWSARLQEGLLRKSRQSILQL